MYENFHIWSIDTDFATIKSGHPILFILTIRGMKTDEIILSTAVDYRSILLDDLEAQMYQHRQTVFSTGPSVAWCKEAYFGKFYEGETTCGLSLQGIGKEIRAKGFSPDTHRLLSWYNTVDIIFFLRAMLGDDGTFSYQPRNILRICSFAFE